MADEFQGVVLVPGREVPKARVDLALRLLGLPSGVSGFELSRAAKVPALEASYGGRVYSRHPIVDSPWSVDDPSGYEVAAFDLTDVPADKRAALVETLQAVVVTAAVPVEQPPF